MKLTEYSVKNHQFTIVIFIMVILVGIVTLQTMPRAEDPQINAPTFPVIAVFPGTSPLDLEELVAKPIEEKIYELDNIKEIITTIEDGLVRFRVEFNYGVNVDNTYQEVVREVNALRSELPENLYSLDVKRLDPSDVNVLQIALASETASYASLRKEADRLKDELDKVPSLKKIGYSGVPEEIVGIDLHLDKMAQLNIPLSMVIGSIKSDALNIPAGNILIDNRSFNVKTSGKFNEIEEIQNTVVSTANGKIILLKDIADVGFKYEDYKHITRINGKRCVLVSAAQKDKANIAATQAAYLPIIENFERTLPENIVLVKSFDQANNVSNRLGTLGRDFLIAIFLVLFTLLPLGIRASFLVMLAIPLSLALGIIGLNMFGISLNQLSIVGLVVALGLLVDDSIVVVENIERWLREGHSKREAAILGTKQIGVAVISTTATLIIAFLPLIFLPGGPGEFVRGLPLAVVSTVFASMLVSLSIVPFLASRFAKPHENPDGNYFLRLMQRGINASYAKLLAKALAHPAKTLMICFAIFVASLSLFPIIGFKLFPTSEKPIFLMNVRMPMQTNIYETNRIMRMVEDSLQKHPEIVYFTSNVGKGNPRIYYNAPQKLEQADFGQVFVQLDESAKPTEKSALIYKLRDQFREFPYARVEITDFEQGPPIEAPISIRVFGENIDTLRTIAAQIEQVLSSHPGTTYVTNNLNVLKSDIKVAINKEKARTLGVLTSDIDNTVRLAISGVQIGQFTQGADDYDMLVRYAREGPATLAAFDNLYVNNALGTPIPISQLATLTFETSAPTINRYNKKRFSYVNAHTQQGVLANDVLKQVVPEINKISLPAGYAIKLSGEAESEGDAFGGNFASVILVAVFLFIAVLILQFKTFKSLLIVLSVIPLGIVGGISMLYLSGNPMSFVAIIGFIGLAGIEVKNSILLVDFTNQLRQQGMPLKEAIERAGEVRFLPIVLTALTAIGGLIPIALNPNPQISPLALVLIGGLISSTVLSRIVTPVMYLLIPPRMNGDNE